MGNIIQLVLGVLTLVLSGGLTTFVVKKTDNLLHRKGYVPLGLSTNGFKIAIWYFYIAFIFFNALPIIGGILFSIYSFFDE